MPSRESQLAALRESLCPYCGLDFAESGGIGFGLCPNCKQPLKWVEGSEIDVDTGKPIYGPCVPGSEKWAKRELDQIALEAAEKTRAAKQQFILIAGLLGGACVLFVVAALGYRGITAVRARLEKSEQQQQERLAAAKREQQEELAEAKRQRERRLEQARNDRERKRVSDYIETKARNAAKVKELCTRNDATWVFKGERLSDDHAEVLAAFDEFEGGVHLQFPNVTEITSGAARSLAGRTRGDLSFDRLGALSNEAAEALAKHSNALSFDGLARLTDEQANALAKHRGNLSLNGLTAVSDKQAESLARHLGEQLALNGLRSLTDKAAAAFAKHKCSLCLNGLTTLTEEQAAVLATHDGSLYLNGITTLTEKAAEILKHPRKGYIKLPD
jgi:hypothetical protein